MNLEELRARRDLWPVVAERIPDCIEHAEQHLLMILEDADIMTHLEHKFRKGEAEHDRDWVRLEDAGALVVEAAEEVMDYILYQAMYIVLLEAKANTNAE